MDAPATIDARRAKRLAWRCRHRGTRELDVLLGRLADRLDEVPAENFDALEALLEVPEPQLMRWLVTPDLPAHPGDADVMRWLRRLVTDGDDASALRALEDRAVLRVTGEDATRFLQGQLTCDVTQLDAGNSCPGAWCSTRGRVVVLFNVYRLPGGDYLLTFPTELSAAGRRLAMFTLRAKAKVTLDSSLRVYGWAQPVGFAWPDALPKPAAGAGSAATHGDALVVGRLPGEGHRVEVVCADAPDGVQVAEPDSGDGWRLDAIRDGAPEVVTATSDHFVPQMLNLELLGAVSFKKGCYVGQEVVARTQHLGRVKRRLYRLSGNGRPPAPGSDVTADGKTVGEVVLAAPSGDGFEALAVLRTEAADASESLVADAATLTLLGPATPLPAGQD